VQDTGKASSQAPDYFAFEARMRGSTAEVRDHQRPYVEDFRECGPVLDIGCGRGEFLELLAEAGIEARGIDTDSDMVAFCRGEALDVEQHDAIAYLAALEDGALGGIFCAHVLEHLLPPVLLRLLELAKAKLRPDGLFVAETPNPRTLVSLSTFFADLTHAQPLHPETLAYLAGQAGLRHVEIRYLNPPPAEGRLRAVPLPEARELQAARETLNANVERLNEVIFGPQDFAVLARA
jgi:SAM-dependent methyltransferase